MPSQLLDTAVVKCAAPKMNYVGKIFTWGKDLYKDLNAATLTGAIDIIVVENADGSLVCSPFHVRFGKLGVIRSKEKDVDIFVNDEQVDLSMKLGDSGVAYFIQENRCGPQPDGGDSVFIQEDRDELGIQPDGTGTVRIERSSARGSVCEVDECDYEQGERDKVRPKKSSISLGSVTSLLERGDDDASSSHRRNMSSELHRRQSCGSSDSELSYKSVAPSLYKNDDDEEEEDSEKATSASLPPIPDSHSATELTASNSKSQAWMHSDVLLMTVRDATPVPDSEIVTRTHPESLPINFRMDEHVHPFSDGEFTRPDSPECPMQEHMSALSDTELAVPKARLAASRQQLSWTWGNLPTRAQSQAPSHDPAVTQPSDNNQAQPTSPQGNDSFLGSVMQRIWPKGVDQQQAQDNDIYLSELNLDDMDPEVAQRYLSCQPSSVGKQDTKDTPNNTEPVGDSGTASLMGSPATTSSILSDPADAAAQTDGPCTESSAASFPSEVMRELQPGNVELSLCGNLKDASGDKAPENFDSHKLSFGAFSQKPDIITSPNLVVRIGKKYYSWQVAAPVILSLLVFQQPLPEKPLHSLMKHHMPKKRRFGWFSSWRGSEPHSENRSGENSELTPSEPLDTTPRRESHLGKARTRVRSFSSDDEVGTADEFGGQSDEERTPSVGVRTVKRASSSANSSAAKALDFDPWQQTLGEDRRENRTLRLTSEQLQQLHLQKGENTITFSVTTKYQGTTATTANIYLWHHTDKIVVSDIDGTITKSDVYGHIMPWFGNDWSHTGVTDLFSAIRCNGYRFVYLSARAIGQARLTRQYLRSVKQGSLTLPDGPVLLNPSSLIHAFHREVIMKKPEEFKIAALRDIASLFSPEPYHAGFGNRMTDVVTYCSVGIPRSRIFTINPTGTLTHEFIRTFQSSYKHLRDLTDQFFPPLNTVSTPAAPEAFNTFNYWRAPMPDLDDLDSLPPL